MITEVELKPVERNPAFFGDRNNVVCGGGNALGLLWFRRSGIFSGLREIAIEILNPELGPGGVSQRGNQPAVNQLANSISCDTEMLRRFFDTEEFSRHVCPVTGWWAGKRHSRTVRAATARHAETHAPRFATGDST
jgi:hypothetical protein